MSDLMELKDHVKATVTMDDVCHRLNIRVPRDRKIHSIYRNEKTPSMHLYKADFYDFATGQGGDVIRFVMDHQGWPFRKTVLWLANQADTTDIRTRTQQATQVEADLTATWMGIKEHQEEPDPPWFGVTIDRWGLTLMQIEDMGSVFSGDRLFTPHWHQGKVRGIKRRYLDARKDSVSGSKYTYGLYVPKHTAYPPGEGQTAWIVEGESDCWVLTDHMRRSAAAVDRYAGHVVYGLPSGASLWRDEWRDHLDAAQTVYIVTDDDDAGKQARERIAGSLLTVRDTGVIHFYPPGGRVAESILAGVWHRATQEPAVVD